MAFNQDTSRLDVLVVASDPLARAGLAAVLSEEPGCTVIGQVDDGAGLPGSIDFHRPDVIAWDLGWGSPVALERLGDLADAAPPIVALIAHDGDAGSAWSAGVRGVIFRDASGGRVAAALLAAREGLSVLDSRVAPAALATGNAPAGPESGDLTPRELEVLALMAEGLPNKAIADRLGISEHTVKFHVHAIMGKLGAQSRTEAVTRATRLGLLIL